MRKTLVINDVHVSVNRTGGTTLKSSAELKAWILERYAALLELAPAHGADRIICNGDLTDIFDSPLAEALELYAVTSAFLTKHPNIELYWALGNHDVSRDSSKLGTVRFVGELLKMRHDNVEVIDRPTRIDDEIYVVPHLRNQDLFDHALSEVPYGTKWLLLHANWDNKFACDSDNSLNLSRDQAKTLKAQGITMVLGHEHQGREALGGYVVIAGNQVPGAVSDCMGHGDGQRDGKKYALLLDAAGHRRIQTWSVDDDDGWFARVNWKELAEVEEEGRGFIRVEGDATTEEAPAVVRAIATFRQRSQSFVVTNAVHIEQAEGLEDFGDSIEDVRSVDVLELLLDQLNEKEQALVRALLAEREVA